MNIKISFLILILGIVNEIACDCGCLKCSKHLQVISPPYLPYKVIIKGSGYPGGQNPMFPPYAPNYNYPVNMASMINQPCQPVFAYKYKLQAPLPPPGPPLAPPMTGLVAKPDRIVIQHNNPTCPVYTADDGACDDEVSSATPPCRSIFQEGFFQAPLPLQPLKLIPARPKIGPILEPITSDFYCDYRYAKSRKKRQVPIFKNSVNFLMGLLPNFLKTFLKPFKYYQNKPELPYQFIQSRFLKPSRNDHRILTKYPEIPYQFIENRLLKPSGTFLQKLQKLNRDKRSVVFDDNEISLPFLRVTDVENDVEDDSSEDSEEESEEEMIDPREEFLRPLNFQHLLPQNPLFYLLNTPIRMLHHFHKFGQQISPVFKSVPHVLIHSKRYLRNFGKHLKNDVLNFASNLIGDFDDVDTHRYRYMPRYRYKRDLNYEPDYSLVFGNHSETKRRKRYILKVVDEDEVEEFLREKLSPIVETTERPKKKLSLVEATEKAKKKKKLLVERLSSKLIIDNKGIPFLEINGVKRPLFRKKISEKEEEKPVKESVEEKKEEATSEDMKDKINSIILQAKERINQNPSNLQHSVPNQIVKDRINQIISEIQNLINIDFDKYSTIHSNLYKLQSYKNLLVTDWKKILTEEKHNDISSKIRLLDEFRELQTLRDKSVKDIASVLSNGSTFMTKKLIKMLVRLQKLQCVIYRVVEDFGERIKMGTEFDVRKEIKYVEYLSGLQFVKSRTIHDLENDLKNERDKALENELSVLEGLRKLSEGHNDSPKFHDEAQLLWEIKNIDKLQKDTIEEMNEKISRGQKVRKELKILFDLLRQLESCEEKQKKLIDELKESGSEESEEESEEIIQIKPVDNHIRKGNGFRRKTLVKNTNFRNRNLPHRTIIEDKKPVKIVSNGYTMTAYKVQDGFN